MAFPMSHENLYDFDVYPKVVCAGRETEINIRPLGGRRIFNTGERYALTVKAIAQGRPTNYPASADYQEIMLTCLEDGGFRFLHTFENEQEYLLDIPYTDHRGKQAKQRFSIYCVDGDLVGLYPYIGDLHLHTTYSDGSQNPEVVCANYRRYGYDFLAITDHYRYFPSLEAMRFYQNVPIGLTIVAGEEVHMPPVKGQIIGPHIVNFGGEYSVNALVTRDDVSNVQIDRDNRSLFGECPDIMTQREFEDALDEVAKGLSIPRGIDAIPAAGVKWVFDEIRKARGLAIYPHPTWIEDVFHVPDVFHDFMVENRMFDAFEVLGGENYFEQNGYQTVRYYEDKARGYRYPIVGSTDSHNSYPCNRNALICSTLVFSRENERRALIDAIKDFRCAAVDTISSEFRLVGETRYVRYGCFLLNNYFPLHDEMCFEEGRLMKQYSTGTPEEREEALQTLKVMNGRMTRFRKKIFAF